VKTNWISRQPIKYWALSMSILGLGACSSTKSGTDASDYSFADVPAADAVDDASGQGETQGGAEGSYSTEIPALEGGAQQANVSGPAYRKSQFPEIASSPIQKDGYSLNGYVFVRNERDWGAVSKLLYGREDRAALLAQWNGNTSIEPGAVVYYNSPFRPDDTSELKAFDSDFGLTLSGVSVSAGESLSSIAANVYGSPEMWRELASLNADLLSHPDRIEVGQTLRLAPATRDTGAILQAYVQKVQNEASTALSDPAVDQSAQVAQTDQVPSESAVATAEGAQAPPAEMAPSSSIPMTEGLALLGVLLAVAGLVASYIRRRKKLEASNAANTVFVSRRKTGTED